MKQKLPTTNIIGKSQNSSQQSGFSLLESVIALTTLGVCLAYAMPLFLYAKVNNSKSEIRTGALIVAQRVFDSVRSQPITSLPTNDGELSPASGSTPTSNPRLLPISADTTAMGREYQATIVYCQNNSTTVPRICGTNYRQFQVQVSYKGKNVYDLQGTYTQFK
jgi:prepilin-type N-terminal cleavage/methylation domain-containing protein